MKRLLLSMAIIAFFTTASVAEDKEPVKWQVTISIKYNAVDWEKAMELFNEIQHHHNACKVSFEIKKPVGEDYILIYDSSGITLAPNNVYKTN